MTPTSRGKTTCATRGNRTAGMMMMQPEFLILQMPDRITAMLLSAAAEPDKLLLEH